VTRSDGRASLWAIRWGRTVGRLRIRITAVKANARAGTFSEHYITSAERGEQRGSGSKQPSISKPRGKWIAIAVAAAGAAAGGLALGLTGRSQSPQPAAASQTADVQVGMPTITIGKP